MKTYYRTVSVPLRIEEEGRVFELKKGQRILTSELREDKGVPVVTVLSTYWVTVPHAHFEGEPEAAYGHSPLSNLFKKPE